MGNLTFIKVPVKSLHMYKNQHWFPVDPHSVRIQTSVCGRSLSSPTFLMVHDLIDHKKTQEVSSVTRFFHQYLTFSSAQRGVTELCGLQVVNIKPICLKHNTFIIFTTEQVLLSPQLVLRRIIGLFLRVSSSCA